MTDTTVHDRVMSSFLLVFPDLDAATVESLTIAADEWDSLASITLLATLEEEFEVTFADDQVAAMTSFDAVVAAVSALPD